MSTERAPLWSPPLPVARRGFWGDHGGAGRSTGHAVAMFAFNLADAARDNDAFRRVLMTGEHVQVVMMSVPAGSEIGSEVHEHNDQVLVIVEGAAVVDVAGERRTLGRSDVVVVPAGAEHNVVNAGDGVLRLCTIYGPPEHPDGTVHESKADAAAAEAAAHG